MAAPLSDAAVRDPAAGKDGDSSAIDYLLRGHREQAKPEARKQ